MLETTLGAGLEAAARTPSFSNPKSNISNPQSKDPQPYWEPAEDAFIIHYTKTVVTAFGDDGGWDEEIGLKTEIVPLAYLGLTGFEDRVTFKLSGGGRKTTGVTGNGIGHGA